MGGSSGVLTAEGHTAEEQGAFTRLGHLFGSTKASQLSNDQLAVAHPIVIQDPTTFGKCECGCYIQLLLLLFFIITCKPAAQLKHILHFHNSNEVCIFFSVFSLFLLLVYLPFVLLIPFSSYQTPPLACCLLLEYWFSHCSES